MSYGSAWSVKRWTLCFLCALIALAAISFCLYKIWPSTFGKWFRGSRKGRHRKPASRRRITSVSTSVDTSASSSVEVKRRGKRHGKRFFSDSEEEEDSITSLYDQISDAISESSSSSSSSSSSVENKMSAGKGKSKKKVVFGKVNSNSIEKSVRNAVVKSPKITSKYFNSLIDNISRTSSKSKKENKQKTVKQPAKKQVVKNTFTSSAESTEESKSIEEVDRKRASNLWYGLSMEEWTRQFHHSFKGLIAKFGSRIARTYLYNLLDFWSDVQIKGLVTETAAESFKTTNVPQTEISKLGRDEYLIEVARHLNEMFKEALHDSYRGGPFYSEDEDHKIDRDVSFNPSNINPIFDSNKLTKKPDVLLRSFPSYCPSPPPSDYRPDALAREHLVLLKYDAESGNIIKYFGKRQNNENCSDHQYAVFFMADFEYIMPRVMGKYLAMDVAVDGERIRLESETFGLDRTFLTALFKFREVKNPDVYVPLIHQSLYPAPSPAPSNLNIITDD